MAELITEFGRSPDTTKLDFGHDFEAFQDHENRSCVDIRRLSHTWSLTLDSEDVAWRQVLSSLSARSTEASDPDPDPIIPSPLPSADRSIPRSESEPDVTSSIVSESINIQSDLLDPLTRGEPLEELGFGELRLSSEPVRPSSQKPIIEVLSSTPASHPTSPALEAYDIPQEDLESLYPSEPINLSPDKKNVSPAYEPEGYDFEQLEAKKDSKLIYLSQLSEYLKDSENVHRIRIGLKEASGLIRQKPGWGTDLSEHAVDLVFALLNLQDNFDLEGFERYRQSALVSLVVTHPSQVGSCLIEQLFYHQYSITQRTTVLNSIVVGLLELANPSTTRNLSQCHAGDLSSSTGFKLMPSRSIHQALMNHQVDLARFEHHSLYSIDQDPSQSSHDLSFPPTTRTPQPEPKWRSKRLQIQKKPLVQDDFSSCPSSTSDPTINTLEIERGLLTSLVNRLHWYLDQFNVRMMSSEQPLIPSTVRSTPGPAHPRALHWGSGWMILFEPVVLFKIIETLKIMSLLIISRSTSPSAGGHSTILHSNSQMMDIVREVVYLLVRLINFLSAKNDHQEELGNSRSSGETSDSNTPEEGVNDQMIIKSSLELIVQLLIRIRFNPRSSPPSTYPLGDGRDDDRLMKISGGGHHQLGDCLEQIRFDESLFRLLSLLSVLERRQVDDHHGSGRSPFTLGLLPPTSPDGLDSILKTILDILRSI